MFWIIPESGPAGRLNPPDSGGLIPQPTHRETVPGDADFPALLCRPFQQRLQLGLKVRGGGRGRGGSVFVGGGPQHILCRQDR